MSNYNSINLLVDKEDINILLGLISREIIEMERIKTTLEERGVGMSRCGINVRLIDLRHLHEQITGELDGKKW